MLLRSQGNAGEPFEEAAGDVALERAHRFALGLSFADAAVEVGARLWLVLGADHCDRVDRVVGLTVTSAAEPVSDCLARGGWQWRGSIAPSEGCLVLEARGVASEQLRG